MDEKEEASHEVKSMITLLLLYSALSLYFAIILFFLLHFSLFHLFICVFVLVELLGPRATTPKTTR